MGALLPKFMSFVVPVMADAAVKGVVLLAAAGVATLAMRRASAAMRHLVWTLAILGLLALPALSALLPQWQVLPQWPYLDPTATSSYDVARPPPSSGVAQAPATLRSGDTSLRSTSPAVNDAAAVAQPFDRLRAVSNVERPPSAVNNLAYLPPDNRSLPWREWLPAVWLFGAAIALLPVVVGRVALWRLCRGARRIEPASPWTDLLRTLADKMRLRRRIVLMRSERSVMPMAWGIRRARILLPGESDDWPAERRRLVLLHEMAHIHRRDCLTQFLTNLACAMHWFNPLVWIARRRMVAERERACDDLVLAAGFQPSDYAQELLTVAAGLRGGFLASGAAIAMARPSKLEGRLLAILDASRKRVMTPRGLWCCICALTVCAILLACTATPFRGGPIPLETLMANYRANPDQKTAQALADVLSFRNPSKEEAEEILRLIMQTRISVRDKYAEGKQVYVLGEAAYPFHPKVHGLSARESDTIFLDGKKMSSGSQGSPSGSHMQGSSDIGHAGCGSHNFGRLPLGTHEVVVRIGCKLWPVEGEKVPVGAPRYDWAGPRPESLAVRRGITNHTGAPLYEVEYDVPVTIHVVPDEEAEEVALVSNPELDAAVRNSVEIFRRGHKWISGHDDRIVRGDEGDSIRFDALPINLISKVRFQDENGNILDAAVPRQFILRANQPALELCPGDPIPLDHYPLGVNRGKLIFTPDPELAYRHPDIKTIWGGTLKIPVEFEVSLPDPDAGPAPVDPQRDESVKPRARIEVSVQLVKTDRELPPVLENTDWGDKALAKAVVTVESGSKGSVLLGTASTVEPATGWTTFRADLAPVLSVDGKFVTVELAVSRVQATSAGERNQAMASTIRIPMNKAVLAGGTAGAPEDFSFVVGARLAPEEAPPTDTAVAPEPENTAPSPRVLPAVVPLGNLPTAAANTKVIRYTVKGGDTLAAIAKQHLGSETKWPDIARENGLSNRYIQALKIGDVLTITVPE